ncbi:MAG: cell division protein ZapA [Ectothiorhodospiraceae bacterium AqS1]|nr:cell division protein ZapA [Ectothiorhodospiraceae bacterium AqS1]
MSDDESEVVTIRVLDKEYSVICPPGEREGLLASASLLDEGFREMRKSGKVIGTERMAVMTALNAVHQVEKIKAEQAEIVAKAQGEVERMEARLNETIARFNASASSEKASSKKKGIEDDADNGRSRGDLSTDPEWFGLASPDPLISDTLAESEGPLPPPAASPEKGAPAPDHQGLDAAAKDEPIDPDLVRPAAIPDEDAFGLDSRVSSDPLFPAAKDDDPPPRST